jgi:hypothetical protein
VEAEDGRVVVRVAPRVVERPKDQREHEIKLVAP